MKLSAIPAMLLSAAVAVSAFSFDADAQPYVSAASAVAINADTGRLLYEKNAHEKRAMASTTKIMTALLTLEAGDLDRPFTVDSMAIRVEGTSMGLREGDTVTRRALCCGMLLPSGNDAANAAAVNIAGSTEAFAAMMNKRAERIGMKDTHFVTPSGLDADGHYTTAYDMALLAAEAMKNSDFAYICGQQYMTVEFGSPPSKRTLYNSNKLLRLYDGCTGIKTGFTDNARRCLVSAAEKDGTRVIAVTLSAPDDWNDHARMLDYSFSRLSSCRIDTNMFAVDVIGGVEEVISAAGDGITLGLTEEERAGVTVSYHLPPFVYADIKKGDRIGRAEVRIDGSTIAVLPIKALSDCKKAEREKNIFEKIADFFCQFSD